MSKRRNRMKRKREDNQGWSNGGIVALDLDHTDNEDDKQPDIMHRLWVPRLYGVAAFRGLEAFGAIPELAWLFSASACELGFTSSWDGLCAIAMIGGGEKKHGNAASTMGPPEHMTHAAALQRRILGRLKQLPPRLQAIIETAYTDRRYQTPDVLRYGPGVVAIVKRAHYVKAALGRSPLGQELALLQGLLMSLSGCEHHAPPDWSPLESELHEATDDFDERELNAGQALLTMAHEAYRRTMPAQPKTRKRRKPRRQRDLVLIPADTVGAAKRRLIPVPRAEAACSI